jgi:hypothetical protein
MKVSLTAPAVSAAFTPSATFTPPAAMTLAGHHRARLVHHQSAAHQIPAIARFDGMIRGRIIVDFYKSKTASLPGKPIPHHVYAVNVNTGLSKEICNIGLGRRIGEVPYKKFH